MAEEKKNENSKKRFFGRKNNLKKKIEELSGLKSRMDEIRKLKEQLRPTPIGNIEEIDEDGVEIDGIYEVLENKQIKSKITC